MLVLSNYHAQVNDLQYYLKKHNINKTLIHMIAGKHEKELTRLNILSTLLLITLQLLVINSNF
jgi:hypothetical protein